MAKRRRLDDDLKRDLSGKDLKQLLRRAHLPEDYPKLTPRNQREARLSVLTSWFDTDRPHILCTDVNKYVAAHFLWTEFYMKPARCNLGVYYFRDFADKYEIVRTVMSPPKIESEPAKSIIKATRRTGKTQTIVVEMPVMTCIVRPYMGVLLSELNDKRTMEELRKIRSQVEDNERIHSDFGGEGVLFPRRGQGKTWSDHHLQFLHYPGCEVMAHSLGSAQRGRGPLLGIIDDPEDEDNTYNRDWRKWFFAKLFDVYVQMFHYGGKIVWIGTPIHAGSCLSLAFKGLSESEEESKNDDAVTVADKRFRDWYKGYYPVIVKKDDGSYESRQPDRLTEKAFQRKMEIDPISARKEILCEPVTPGVRAFSYDPYRHGYMICRDDNGDYMLDLYTGIRKPLVRFKQELLVYGAGDLADGQTQEADPGAVVIIGVDPDGIIFVLDCYQAKCIAEKLVERAYFLAEEWDCGVFGWERTGLLCVVNRVIPQAHVEKLRQEGKSPPLFRELDNAKKNKIRRILSMSPLFSHCQVRFPVFDRIKDPDGVVHTPLTSPREVCFRDLIAQVQEYTDEGIRGHDDLIDALEMATRMCGRRRGEILDDRLENNTDHVIAQWAKVGLHIETAKVPQEAWSPKMVREMQPFPAVEIGDGLVPCV